MLHRDEMVKRAKIYIDFFHDVYKKNGKVRNMLN